MGKEEVTETFAEAKGLPSNAHAKKLAKENGKSKHPTLGVYYTEKNSKCMKMVIKADRVMNVYIGHMIKHKDGLALSIKAWKEQGLWLEPHQVEEKIEEVMAGKKKK